jgi:hypothetical protein
LLLGILLLSMAKEDAYHLLVLRNAVRADKLERTVSDRGSIARGPWSRVKADYSGGQPLFAASFI